MTSPKPLLRLSRARPMLSPSDVARRLKCHPKTVRKLIKNGQLPAFASHSAHPNGVRYELDPTEVEKFCELYKPRRVVGPMKPYEGIAEGAF